jgi:hypothetical protein
MALNKGETVCGNIAGHGEEPRFCRLSRSLLFLMAYVCTKQSAGNLRMEPRKLFFSKYMLFCIV